MLMGLGAPSVAEVGDAHKELFFSTRKSDPKGVFLMQLVKMVPHKVPWKRVEFPLLA